MNLLEYISDDIKVPIKSLEYAVYKSREQVRLIKVKKSDGSERKTFHPSKKTKLIQYWLNHNVFRLLPVHDSAAAYIRGKSIRDNAAYHTKNRYFLRIDFKDFFPSIVYGDFAPIILAWHNKAKPGWAWNIEAEKVIMKCCFYQQNRLPIGYPTSPMISNIVMYSFDETVNNMLKYKEEKLGRTFYTRYADDLIFSTNKKGTCTAIVKELRKIIKATKSPNLIINENKTRITSSSGGSAIVTGLRICHDHHVTIHRKYKDEIRLLCSLMKKNLLADKDKEKLKGHLAYIQHADPAFYSKMQIKFFAEISSL